MVGIGTMLVGVVTGITSGYWDLNQVIPDLFQSKTVLILSLLVIMFAQWSTNTAANLLPPTLVLLNIYPELKDLNIEVICGVNSKGMNTGIERHRP